MTLQCLGEWFIKYRKDVAMGKIFTHTLLYIFLFCALTMGIALLAGMDPIFFLGANILYLAGAFLSFKAKDILRNVLIVAFLSFGAAYGAGDLAAGFIVFYMKFFQNIVVLWMATFLYLKIIASDEEVVVYEDAEVVDVSEKELDEIIKKTSIQLLHETVESLSKITKCGDPIKVKMVVLAIYKGLTQRQNLDNTEAENVDEIIKEVLDSNSEHFHELKRYFNIYTINQDEIAATDKDASAKLFSMAQIHAMYLFREKRDYELINETMAIVEHYDLILKIINIANKQNYYKKNQEHEDTEVVDVSEEPHVQEESEIPSPQKTNFPILSFEEFLSKTSGGWPCRMNTSAYHGHTFMCACGKTHVFGPDVEVMRELSDMRLVFLCPNDENSITCVKVKGLLKFREFRSLFGTSGNV